MSKKLFDQRAIARLETDLVSALSADGQLVRGAKLSKKIGEGYNATVFSVLVDGEEYVLKVFRQPVAFELEARNVLDLPDVSHVVLVWRKQESGFDHNMILFKRPKGAEFRSVDLTDKVADGLEHALSRLHSQTSEQTADVTQILADIDNYYDAAQAHAEMFGMSKNDFDEQVDFAKLFLANNAAKFQVATTVIHGDLWWSNIIVTSDSVYLIDWDKIGHADYCLDLAQLRVFFDFVRIYRPYSFWVRRSDKRKLTKFMNTILKLHAARFADNTIIDRYNFYCWYYSMKQLSDFYAKSMRGSQTARDMMQTGVIHLELLRQKETA